MGTCNFIKYVADMWFLMICSKLDSQRFESDGQLPIHMRNVGESFTIVFACNVIYTRISQEMGFI